MLHLNEIAALKAAEAHLLQVFHLHEPCTREEHLSGLPGAAERGDIDRFRPEVSLPQLGAARGAQGDIPLALIALFGVVGRQAMAQKIDQHGGSSPFNTVGIPQNICTTHPARAASRQASRPAASRAARSPASMGTTPPPTSVAITIS